MAKRKRNWERLDGPFPNNRRGNLHVNQGHAFDHWRGRCMNDLGAIPNPPCFPDMACPVCGEIKGFNHFTEDHCPQKSGQSNFGGPSCIVLVCKDCNGQPGRTYEGRTAQIRNGDRAPDHKIIYGATGVDGRFRFDGIGDSSQTATDQKTAFLVAFAALGYHFALHPMYDHIRQSIRDGSAPTGGGPIRATDLQDLEDESVYEHDNGVIYVVGRGYGWMLTPNTNEQLLGNSGRRRWEWPETHSSGNHKQFQEHFASGGVFHVDFCTSGDHAAWQQVNT